MPITVPTLQDRQVQPAAFPNQRLSPEAPVEAFGGGSVASGPSQAAANLFGDAAKIAQREYDQANFTVAQDAEYKGILEENTLLNHPENGLLTKKGHDALGLTAVGSDLFHKKLDEIESGLTNDNQRALFSVTRQKLESDLQQKLERHAFTEYNAYKLQVQENLNTVNKDTAILNADDFPKLTDSLEQQKMALNKIGEMKYGLSADALVKFTNSEISNTKLAIVKQLVNGGKYQQAKNFLDIYQATMDPGPINEAKAVLREGTLRGESSDRALKLVQQYPDDPVAVLEQAKKIKDPEMRDLVIAKAEKNLQNEKQARQAQQDNIYLKWQKSFADKSDPTLTAREQVSSAEWLAMTEQQRGALQKQLEDPQTNPKIWQAFRSLTPKELTDLSKADFYSKYYPNFSQSDRKAAEGIYFNSQDPAKAKELKSYFSDKDIVLTALKTAGIFDAKMDRGKIKKSNEKSETLTNFEIAFDNKRQDFYNKTGKVPNDEQEKKMLKEILNDKIFVERGIFGTKKEIPKFQLTQKEKLEGSVSFDQVPAHAIKKLISTARAMGVINNKLDDEQAKVILRKNIERAYWRATIHMDDEDIFDALKIPLNDKSIFGRSGE